MITKLLDGVNPADWVDQLGPRALAYNSTVHTTTGFCPHELFYSIRPSCPLDVFVDMPEEDAVNMADEYALQVSERIQEAFRFMREYSSPQTERIRSNYDALSLNLLKRELMFCCSCQSQSKVPILSGLSFTRGRTKS